MQYDNPKLFDTLRRGGNCPICGEDVPAGAPGWIWNNGIYCASHPRTAVVEAGKTNAAALREGTPISTYPSNERTLLDGFASIVQAIEQQTRALQVMSASLATVSQEMKEATIELQVIAGRMQK